MCRRVIPMASTKGKVLMYGITGITGKVGGAVARTLLSEGQRVRAVIRDPNKDRFWSDLGCEVAIAEMEDAEALDGHSQTSAP